jgi:putative hydrolase of the HAD superfamily
MALAAALRRRRRRAVAARGKPQAGHALAAYWFEHDYHPNESLLEEIGALRARGLRAHLATVQEHERARYIWETRGLNARFDAIHYAADLGVAKPDPAFFAAIEARTGLPAETLAFIDDKAANVEAARRRGWLARVWTGRVRLAELMPELFADR